MQITSISRAMKYTDNSLVSGHRFCSLRCISDLPNFLNRNPPRARSSVAVVVWKVHLLRRQEYRTGRAVVARPVLSLLFSRRPQGWPSACSWDLAVVRGCQDFEDSE